MSLSPDIATRLKFDSAGLIPVVVQDVQNGDVLMVAWTNEEALAHTLVTRRGTYWSRSRRELWIKGLTSGNTQHVVDIQLDCDGDTLLYLVEQVGAACHTGTRTCFSPLEQS